MNWPIPELSDGISEHQQEQIAIAGSSTLGIFAGEPGTGKTHTIARLIKRTLQKYGTGNVAICSPTGKAAVRCNEAMLENEIKGVEATTIHRMLQVSRNGHDGGGWEFQHNHTNPLPFHFVICDEVSMLDTNLAACLFDALPRGAHFIMVGDINQLPPVGHGAPLRDMIAAGVPYGVLTEVHRNEGGIVKACQKIKAGNGFVPSPYVCIEKGENLAHHEAATGEAVIRKLKQLIKNVPQEIDRTWDIQVLCAVNEKSSLSRKELNRILQAILNPPQDEEDQRRKFRVNDKVICLKNTMLHVVDGDADEAEEAEDFVANGEIGQIVEIVDKSILVKFFAPERTVRVPTGKATKGGINDFDLAYAITTHKSQGSSAKIIIAIIDDYAGANFVCSREWWYTGLSRAEKLCITIGKASVINKHCKRVALKERKTFLKELINENNP